MLYEKTNDFLESIYSWKMELIECVNLSQFTVQWLNLTVGEIVWLQDRVIQRVGAL